MSGALDITAFIVDTAAGDPAAKVYYGNAEPEGHTVIVGGQAVVVGGWAAYEATRREARWQANPALPAAEPRGRYGGRTYVTGQDAVESLLVARQSDPLARAAPRLAAAVAKFNAAVLREGPTSLWDRLGIPSDAPVAVSTITPVEISQAAAETDLEALHRAAEDAAILASGYARDDELPGLRAPRPPGGLPPLPAREVPLRGRDAAAVNRSIVELERASVPRAAAVEAYRGDVAAVFDAAAAVLERAVA